MNIGTTGKKLAAIVPVLLVATFAAVLTQYGCDMEEWGPIAYPNKGKYKVTLANEADSCAGKHYYIGIDKYFVGHYDNILPVILNVDSGIHRMSLACSSRYEAGIFTLRLHDSILITGDTTLYIDCDSCHPDY